MTDAKRAPSRIVLFVPFVLVLVAAVLHAVYWTYTASQIEQRALAWIETQQAAGYDVAYEQLRVGGYPFRFRMHATAPQLTAPAGEGGWTARVERLSASAQFYDLNHWIVVADGEGSVLTDGELYTLNAEAARLSLRAREGRTSRVGASVEALTISGPEGREPAITAIGSLALSGRVDDEDQLLVGIDTQDLQLGEGALDRDLLEAFGREASVLRVDAAVTQWTALARRADPYEWRQAGGQLVINQSQLVWGPAELAGSGEIGLDADLLPEGRLSVVVTDPETLITALETAGLVVDEQGEALRLAALMAPRREGGIALPFRLRNGGIFLGPARIGTFAEAGG